MFVRALQQAIGGVADEIRVMLQYLIQAWGARSPIKPLGELATLALASPDGVAQRGQVSADPAQSAQMLADSQIGLPSSPAKVL